MKDLGMHIGSHSMNHEWHAYMTREEQNLQMKYSIKFLKEIRNNPTYFSICYPFGSCNQDTIEVAAEHGFQLGLTTELFQANYDEHHPLALPRLDTNEFPKDRNTPPNYSFTDRYTNVLCE